MLFPIFLPAMLSSSFIANSPTYTSAVDSTPPSPTYEDLLFRIAKVGCEWSVNARGAIRDSKGRCPMVALAEHEITGVSLRATDYITAARVLGIGSFARCIEQVVHAADARAAEGRAALLNALHLEEPAQLPIVVTDYYSFTPFDDYVKNNAPANSALKELQAQVDVMQTAYKELIDNILMEVPKHALDMEVAPA